MALVSAPRPIWSKGLARWMSKRGFASRSEATDWIRSGRISVDGSLVRDPAHPPPGPASIVLLDGIPLAAVAPLGTYLVMNKPRGWVTTRCDEKHRTTVYEGLPGIDPRRVFPVGRLDQASEGLLLFTDDSKWSNRILAPEFKTPKTYHVQVRPVPTRADLERFQTGVTCPDGEMLSVFSAQILRSGGRTAWLEIILHAGRNRHIRRLLAATGFETLRLIRTAIGTLGLGTLAKGASRPLLEAEVESLSGEAEKDTGHH